jgi:tetratricopeptide (TPR) repeat protein
VSASGTAVPQRNTPFLLALALLGVLLAYANHFGNSFHFDDFHAVTDNPWIRNLGNVPRFFVDAATVSTLPANRVYRPLLTTSLAIDYWLGGGLQPHFFHLSTFFWFLLQIVLMFFLFRTVFDRVRPDPRNRYVALFGAAWYGLHPANAETVNYIVQRADLYSTLGVVAGLLAYAARPALRKYGLYLIPVALALLAKPPALVFPAILFAYVFLFEQDGRRDRVGAAWKASIPSIAVTVALLALQGAMTPRTWIGGASSALAYRITQPFIALRYFGEFFLPLWLSADTDRQPFSSPWDGDALLGFAFAIALVVAAFRLTRRRETRPIAFGLFWFLLALLPTSLFPLAEVENDHRMFFPFVGLAMSVPWSLALWLLYRPTNPGTGDDSPRRKTTRNNPPVAAESRRLSPHWPRKTTALATAAVCLLIACGWGVHERNQVWHTEESLWLDVTEKSPHNGRGLMNYGLTQMSKGEIRTALDYFERALVYTPNYATLEINLGIANGSLNRDQQAETHFRRAIELAPGDAQTHFYYGRWLWGKRRASETLGELRIAAALNPPYLDPRYLLMQVYAEQHAWIALTEVANQVLSIAPGDAIASSYLNRARSGGDELSQAERAARAQPSPEAYLQLSLLYHQAGRYRECIEAAGQALRLRPDYAEAYNNMAAAYEAMSMWDAAIEAARQALRIKPDFPLARNNLAWSLQQKKKGATGQR